MLNPEAKSIPARQKKSAQELSIRQAQDKQDEIFRKMPFEQKIKLASDFMTFGLKNKLPQGTKMSLDYLQHWLRKEGLFAEYTQYFH